MARYQIIDEPNVKTWGEKLIVNPIVILFAAIFVPLFWQPPALGRFWMPLVWLIVNGLALGSSTFRQEIRAIVFGVLGAWLILAIAGLLTRPGMLALEPEAVTPYSVIAVFGVYFLTLYLVVFKQSRSFELYHYIHQKSA